MWVVCLCAAGAQQLPPLLENWRMTAEGGVRGNVYGKEGFDDGEPATTSEVAERVGNVVTTISGSKSVPRRKPPLP